MVARPPHLRVPKRRKGTESVVIPGATSRITMTFSGSAGTNLLVMMVVKFGCSDVGGGLMCDLLNGESCQGKRGSAYLY